jgi:hypothetical protein
MQTIFRAYEFKFYFSDEGSPLEPVNVHVEKAEVDAEV